MTDKCPNCSDDIVIINDPGLPPNLGNAECENISCGWIETEIQIA